MTRAQVGRDRILSSPASSSSSGAPSSCHSCGDTRPGRRGPWRLARGSGPSGAFSPLGARGSRSADPVAVIVEELRATSRTEPSTPRESGTSNLLRRHYRRRPEGAGGRAPGPPGGPICGRSQRSGIHAQALEPGEALLRAPRTPPSRGRSGIGPRVSMIITFCFPAREPSRRAAPNGAVPGGAQNCDRNFQAAGPAKGAGSWTPAKGHQTTG